MTCCDIFYAPSKLIYIVKSLREKSLLLKTFALKFHKTINEGGLRKIKYRFFKGIKKKLFYKLKPRYFELYFILNFYIMKSSEADKRLKGDHNIFQHFF